MNTQKNQFRVGGVPEHFNLPWHLAIENQAFENAGLKVSWKDFPSGTGDIAEALESGELDMASSLTEGIVNKIIQGYDIQILQFYVRSPLKWGIFVSADSNYQKVEELEGARYAISRMGSGSHLMAYVDAQRRNWQFREDQLVPAKNLRGMVEALKSGKADVMLWETYTTKPYVTSGDLRFLGETVTPWPGFLIAVRKDLVENQPEVIARIQKVINQTCQNFMKAPDATETLAKRFDMSLHDAQTWFRDTEWATNARIEAHHLENTMQTLEDLGIINHQLPVEQLVSPLTEVIDEVHYR